MRRHKKLIAKVLVLALIFGVVIWQRGGKEAFTNIPHAKAGNISSPAWTLSDSTLGATGVTYTHTFTTATEIPAQTGRVEILLTLDTPNHPRFDAQIGLGAATTDALESSWAELYPDGPQRMIIAVQNSSQAAIPAGTVTIALTNLQNPSQGGVVYTNTYTLNNGQALDGNKNGASNGTIAMGDISLTITVTDAATENPVGGYELEIHPQQCCGGMWRAKTGSNQNDLDNYGKAKFYGVTDGTYILETSHGMDPNSPGGASLSQYMSIEPQNITFPLQTPTMSIALQKSNKFINVTVKYADTGTVIQGAFVNAFTMGGSGFAFGQTNAQGVASLNMALKNDKSNVNVMVMPPMGPPPGQGGPGQQQLPEFVSKPPVPVAFNQPASVAETVSMEVLVERPNATVTGKLVNPDGTPATGGLGANNFRTHQHQPLMLQQDGSFSFKTSSSTGEWMLDRFDPSGQYAMPKTKFTVKAGTTDIGTIRLIAFDGSIAIKAYRVDSGADVALSNIPVMAFNSKEQGPPTMGFTGSDGTGTIRVMKGQTYRIMANPGGGGPGMREGGPKDGPGGPGDGPIGIIKWIDSAYAQQPVGQMGAADASQLFPVTGPQKGSNGDTLTFKFDKASIQVTVITKDSAGNSVTDGNFVNARPIGGGGPQFGPGFGGPGSGGQATVYTTTGKFIFNAFYPPDSEYVGREKEVDITANSNVELVVSKKTVTITGEIQDASNNNAVISGETAKKLNLMVGAFFKGGFSDGAVDTATGTYSIKVPPLVDVNVGVAPADAIMGGTSEYVPSLSPDPVNAADGATVTRHLKLAKVDATINVTVKDQNGNGLEGVTVFANNKLSDIVGEGPGGEGPRPEGPEGPEFGFEDVTDATGKATIMVAPDAYNLVTNARERGLFATEQTKVTIASQETKAVDINLVQADATLEVEVNKSDGTDLNEASVQVFNDAGTIAFQVYDGSEDDKDGAVNGVVKFDIPSNKTGDSYNVQAGKDNPEAGSVEESVLSKVIIDRNEDEKTTLPTTLQADALAKPVSSSVDTSSTASIELTKGGESEVSLSIPAGAFSSGTSSEESEDSSSSGTATVSLTPLQAESVNTKGDNVITGVKIEAMDSSGNNISTLSSQATVTISYEDSDIPTGMTEANFIEKASLKSFDDNAGKWDSLITSKCDAATNTCTAITNHFTDFAITTSSDTTAPAAPTSIAASAGDQKATLTWVNPTDSDLVGIKVYRSTTSGTVGDLITTIDNKTTLSYENTGLTNGITYYYTVRSYDTAGNISMNTAQVNATPGVLPLTGSESWPMKMWLKAVNLLSNLF